MNTFLPFRSPASAALAPLAALALGAMVTAAGCTVEQGPDGDTSFSFDSIGSLSTPLAAGASDGISIGVDSDVVVAKATSSDPAVLTLGAVTGSDGAYDVPVTGGNPGSATLTVFDPTGKQLAQATVLVAATTSIPLSAPTGVTVMENQTFAVHAKTIGAGGVTLAGVGAIHFAYAGSLASATSTSGFCSGDCGYFQATSAGAGQIDVSAVSTTTSLAVNAVAPTAVDSFSVASTTVQVAPGNFSSTAYTLRSAGAVVQADGSELTCTSSNQSVAFATPAPSLGALAASTTTGSLVVSGAGAGTATLTCSVGSQQVTLNVTVQ